MKKSYLSKANVVSLQCLALAYVIVAVVFVVTMYMTANLERINLSYYARKPIKEPIPKTLLLPSSDPLDLIELYPRFMRPAKTYYIPPVVDQVVDNSEPTQQPPFKGQKLTATLGTTQGPTNRETWYNLPMDRVVQIMRSRGYSEEEYPHWVRDDGCKMLGDYIIVAADLSIHPRGTVVETSLGKGLVCDTGDFKEDIYDIAAEW